MLAFDGGALQEIAPAFAGPLAGATPTADTLRVVLDPVVPRASAAIFFAISTHIEQLGADKVHPVLLIDEAHLLHQDVLDHGCSAISERGSRGERVATVAACTPAWPTAA